MNRVTAAVLAGAAFVLWMDVGSAQQPSSRVRIAATTINELRAWDQTVTAQLRTGDLRVMSVDQDPSMPTRRVERMQQYYQDVPIFGAQIVRDSESGVAQSIFGEVPQALSLDTSPVLTAAAAETETLRRSGSGALMLRRPELVILAETPIGPRLAYMLVVSAKPAVDRVFVDAVTGAELLRFSEVKTQSSAVGTGQGLVGGLKKMSVRPEGAGFVTDDRLRPPVLTTFDLRGNLFRADSVIFDGAPLFPSDLATDSDNQWTDIATVDAHAYIGWTYDYYFKRHGRRGLDNRDRPIVTIVNAARQADFQSVPPDFFGLYVLNAFWCDVCGPGGVGVMYFGNGAPPQFGFNFGVGVQTATYFAGSLDITAHELTHAVTDSSSHLIYLNESGALNEAFSDIMGTSVEFFFQPVGSGLGQADFLLGEDSIRSPFGGLNGSRSLINPAAFGDPDHYSLRYTGTADNGGVHTNSSIANHAFYLAVAGGTNRVSGQTVAGVGIANIEQMEKVFYRAFTLLMPANSTFSTARAATIQAARDLYATTPSVVNAVTQAWTAVGVN
jgi:thermolysin